MNRRNSPASIARLVAAQSAHEAPAIEVLRSELRSDSVIDVPPPPTTKPDPYYVLIKWKYVVPLRLFDKFHEFLAQHEAALVADVADLGVGASYLGTYAEVPHGNPHQTFWSYTNVAAIDAFKTALAKKPRSALRKNLATFIGMVDDPNIVMHRLVRARALAGHVKIKRSTDPILDMFAG